MLEEIDIRAVAASDFDEDSDPPPPPKKTTRGKAAAPKKAPAKAPAKTAAKGRGKKKVRVSIVILSTPMKMLIWSIGRFRRRG